jgi:hypothetical protein
MNEEITEAQLWRQPDHTGASVSRPAETGSEIGYWVASHRSGHSINGTIWAQSTSEDLPEHG